MSLAKSQFPTFACQLHDEGLSFWGLVPRAALFAAALLLMPGCEEDTSPATTTTAPQITKDPGLPRIKWLDAHSEIKPEQWLASREAKVDLDESDPAVVALRIKLNEAARRFGDPPRMIANRAVQLEEMLAEEGIAEHAQELIEALSAVATESQQREGFGSLSQHYFNLRKQGVKRDAAFEQLKKASTYRAGDRINEAEDLANSTFKPERRYATNADPAVSPGNRCEKVEAQ